LFECGSGIILAITLSALKPLRTPAKVGSESSQFLFVAIGVTEAVLSTDKIAFLNNSIVRVISQSHINRIDPTLEN
jgi:hypothetical protein